MNAPLLVERIPDADTPPALHPDRIPEELRQVPQWVNWRWEQREGAAKPTKPPFHPLGFRASHSRPETWSPFPTVLRALRRPERRFAGIGFVFGAADPYCGIDLDGCLDRATGEIAPWAARILERLPSYAEISPSGTGVKVIVRGTLPGGGKKRTGFGADGGGAVEMYDQLRFFTLTGRRLASGPAEVRECVEALPALYRELFPEREVGHYSCGRGPLVPDDETLLQRALRAHNGARFSALWHGDRTPYNGDDSRADLALCGMLAFWTGGDAARIDRLFRRSGLMREKWDERRGATTYGERTLARALSNSRAAYRGEGQRR